MRIGASRLYAVAPLPPHDLDKYNLDSDEEACIREVLEVSIRRAEEDRQRERHRRQSRNIHRHLRGLITCLQSPYVRYGFTVATVIIALVVPFIWCIVDQWSTICDYKVIAIASHTIAFFSTASDYCLSIRNLQDEILQHSQSSEPPTPLAIYTSQGDYMLDKHSITTRASQALALRLEQLSSGLISADDIVRTSGTIHALCSQSLRRVSFAYPKLKAYLSEYSGQTGHLSSAMLAVSNGHSLVAWAESHNLIPRCFRQFTTSGRTERDVIQFYKDFISDTNARQLDAQRIVNLTQQSLTQLDNLDALLLASGQNFSQICIPYLDQVDRQVSIVYQLIQYVIFFIPGLRSSDVAIATDPPMEQCVAHGESGKETSPGKAYADLIVELRSNLTTIRTDALDYAAFHSKTSFCLKTMRSSANSEAGLGDSIQDEESDLEEGDGSGDEDTESVPNEHSTPRVLENYRVTHRSTRKMQELHVRLTEMHEEHKRSRKVDGEEE